MSHRGTPKGPGKDEESVIYHPKLIVFYHLNAILRVRFLSETELPNVITSSEQALVTISPSRSLKRPQNLAPASQAGTGSLGS